MLPIETQKTKKNKKKRIDFDKVIDGLNNGDQSYDKKNYMKETKWITTFGGQCKKPVMKLV